MKVYNIKKPDSWLMAVALSLPIQLNTLGSNINCAENTFIQFDDVTCLPSFDILMDNSIKLF